MAEVKSIAEEEVMEELEGPLMQPAESVFGEEPEHDIDPAEEVAEEVHEEEAAIEALPGDEEAPLLDETALPDGLDQGTSGYDKYEDIREVGRGAFGKVWLVKRKEDGHLYVVKKITDESRFSVSQQKIEEMELEVVVLKKLRHPHIICYEESFLHEGCLCIVQEYAERGTLAFQIQGWRQKNEPPEEHEIMDVFVQLVLAMDHIHSLKIMHRDLKPENIMVTRGDIIKLGDFGLCKVLSDGQKATSLSGTPNYMSPEVVEGRPYDTKCDMWAMGCVLYEMIALRQAFPGADISLVLAITHSEYEPLECGNASPRVRKLVSSLLSHIPRDRPNTGALLAMPFIENVQQSLLKRLANVPVGFGPGEDMPYSEAFPEAYATHGQVKSDAVSASPRLISNQKNGLPIFQSFMESFETEDDLAPNPSILCRSSKAALSTVPKFSASAPSLAANSFGIIPRSTSNASILAGGGDAALSIGQDFGEDGF